MKKKEFVKPAIKVKEIKCYILNSSADPSQGACLRGAYDFDEDDEY